MYIPDLSSLTLNIKLLSCHAKTYPPHAPLPTKNRVGPCIPSTNPWYGRMLTTTFLLPPNNNGADVHDTNKKITALTGVI
jgi:hypothetical protein